MEQVIPFSPLPSVCLPYFLLLPVHCHLPWLLLPYKTSVFNLSTSKMHTESACLHLIPLLLICKHTESAVCFCCQEFICDTVLGCLLRATGVTCVKFSIDFSSNRSQRLHSILNLPDLMTARHKFSCCLCAEIHKTISDPD